MQVIIKIEVDKRLLMHNITIDTLKIGNDQFFFLKKVTILYCLRKFF